MRSFFLSLVVVFGAASLASSGLAQDQEGGALGTSQDIDPDESPVIIERTPGAGQERQGETLRSESDSFVQIQGTWASDAEACATVDEGSGNGLYLTDTLIRWEGATCSIRNTDVEEQRAVVRALCATANGERRERVFRLEATGDSLSFEFDAEGRQQSISLVRCPAQ